MWLLGVVATGLLLAVAATLLLKTKRLRSAEP